MTLSFLRNEIYQQSGEPSDIDPTSDTQYTDSAGSSVPLLNWVVNEGLREIATWVDPMTGRAIRLPEFLGDLFFRSYYETSTLDADAPSATTVQLPSGASTTDDAYNGWTITVGSESHLIVDYTGSTLQATLADSWSTEPDSGDTYELSKNFSYMLPSTDGLVSFHITTPTSGSYHKGNFLIPLKVSDIADTFDLDKAPGVEGYSGLFAEPGQPTEWYWTANKLVFNYTPDERRWYKMEYYRLPKTLVATTDEPDIPEFLQYGAVLWGIWWSYKRQQASPEAYSAKKDFEDYMRQRLNLYSVEYLREDDYATVRLS